MGNNDFSLWQSPWRWTRSEAHTFWRTLRHNNNARILYRLFSWICPQIQSSCCPGVSLWRYEYLGDAVGNPNPYSYVPDAFQDFSDKMSFRERVLNTLGGLFQQMCGRHFVNRRQEVIMKKHFNYTSSMPSITDLGKSTALVLVNNHFSISYPKPMMPNYVQVGGMHVKPPKSLPAVSTLVYTLHIVRWEEI